MQILVVPPAQSPDVAPWLRIVAANMSGFKSQPEVIRRSCNQRGEKAEVRRWSEAEYLPLAGQRPRHPGAGLYLNKAGMLLERTLDGKRYLRKDPGDYIADEIYVFAPLSVVTDAQLAVVQQRAVTTMLPVGFRNWAQMPKVLREDLAAFGGNWEDAKAALTSVEGEDYLHTLQLFLSERVHPQLRTEVLNAGLDGRHHPTPAALPWLLAQADWNLNPCLVAMARNAAQEDPEQAWLLYRHPNAQVRLRLIDVYTGPADWFTWLVCESDTRVRTRILGAIEQSYNIAGLVEQLSHEQDEARCEAIGWVLAHWRPIVEDKQDWQALNNALFMDIGKTNRRDLKESLAKHGKLSLRGRFFT